MSSAKISLRDLMVYASGRRRSIRCAAAGVGYVVRSQKNAWIHAAASAALIGIAAFLHLTGGEWCWLVIAMTCVWMAEALNTALELVCDVVSPQAHPGIGRAKDVAAGGVLLAACGAAAIGACVLVPRLVMLL